MPASLLLHAPGVPPASFVAPPPPAITQDLERVESYPVLSETAARAMAVVNNPNVSVGEVAGLIRCDAVLAAAMLRRANNWAYGGRPIEDIRQAVLRVGLQECGKLLCTLGTRALYERHPEAVRERCDAVHRHSVFVAQLASELNRTAGFGFSGAEFTAGLLHDIGRVILFVKCPPTADDAPTSAAGEDVLVLERMRYGTDHCVVGRLFAEKNRLPAQITGVIANHHRPERDLLQPQLVALIAFANRLANYAQWEHNVTKYNLAACPAYRLLSAGWTPQRAEAFAAALPGVAVRAIKGTRVMLKSTG